MKVLMHHSQRAARSFVRGLEIRLYAKKKTAYGTLGTIVCRSKQRNCQFIKLSFALGPYGKYCWRYPRTFQLYYKFNEIETMIHLFIYWIALFVVDSYMHVLTVVHCHYRTKPKLDSIYLYYRGHFIFRSRICCFPSRRILAKSTSSLSTFAWYHAFEWFWNFIFVSQWFINCSSSRSSVYSVYIYSVSQ
jgi:hypothetical protein